MSRSGYELPLLLAGAFRSIIEELHLELAERGHPHARPIHGFALQAIGPDGVSVGELGRRLGVTKQAAAGTARGLEAIGYVSRAPDPADARAVILTRSRRGEELLILSAEIFARLRRRWARELGASRLAEVEEALLSLAGHDAAAVTRLPGWLS